MSLSSSLHTGTSGLGNTSKALQVTSNNIANTNTLAFKRGSTTFSDSLYRAVGTQAGAGQVGLGMSVGNVSQDFKDGSPESTSNSTDLAISGDGFFAVSQAGSEETYYTRAGNFSFNESGALVNPGGYILQGWHVDAEGNAVGAVTDLVLTASSSAPKKTEEMTMIVNLSSKSNGSLSVLSNKYNYKEGKTTTISSDTYEHQSPVTVYDSLGSAHEVTVYYDKKSSTEWEYVIVSNPEEDKRSLVGDTTSKGLLARGTITFSESSSEIVSMTMEEFTGRVGNVETTGVNSADGINFEIEDSEAMRLDGYGIEMNYDGNQWVLDTATLPTAYKDAEIIYSNDQNIYLVLDPASSGKTEEADLKIKLDKVAMSGDTIRFDVNDTKALHEQDLLSIISKGDAFNNTNYEVKNPGVMTRDAENCGIVWNHLTESWQWSNPTDAADAGTLVTGMTTNAPTAVNTSDAAITINNAKDLTMTVEDINLRYNAGAWDWNEPLKEKDIVNQANTLENQNTKITRKIITAGDEGAVATASDISLTWNGTAWSATGSNLNPTIVTAESNSTQVQVQIYDAASGQASVIQYSFDEPMTAAAGQTISFGIDPSPPAEYADAKITTTANDSVAIDFNGEGTTDLTLEVNSGMTGTLANGDTLKFEVNADVPPVEYSNAALTGDKTKAVIDLDGSGGEDDKKDIVFTFSEDLKTEEASTITFDISGSSAWRECAMDEAKDTGYFKFTTDFLGGEFGTTETDISLNIGSQWNGNNWVNDSFSTTRSSKANSTTYQDSDGYPPGDLTKVEVSSDGTVIGKYSNNQTLALFKVALADFVNPNGLVSKGGNLYSETLESGSAITNTAGSNGLGKVASYNLEMSNVDISDEFVSMIKLQNAYEANAKVISTVDEMMNTVIAMKR